MCSNFYLKTNDGKHWLANDRGDIYLFERMENGYAVETLFEDEFCERYPKPGDNLVEGAKTTKRKVNISSEKKICNRMK